MAKRKVRPNDISLHPECVLAMVHLGVTHRWIDSLGFFEKMDKRGVKAPTLGAPFLAAQGTHNSCQEGKTILPGIGWHTFKDDQEDLLLPPEMRDQAAVEVA